MIWLELILAVVVVVGITVMILGAHIHTLEKQLQYLLDEEKKRLKREERTLLALECHNDALDGIVEKVKILEAQAGIRA